MKNRLKIIKTFVFSLVLAGSCFPSAFAQNNSKRIDDLDDLTFVEMINSVPLDEKSGALVTKFQEKEARERLLKSYGVQKNGCNVETYRNKEVLLITIPASKLFYPNAKELRPDASVLLSPIKRYLKDSDMYRVLIVMHTDNTGSKGYREMITEERCNAVFDWFAEHSDATRYLFSYAYADEMPLRENNSMENRDQNRRLEIYLVPGKAMERQAKTGKIAF